MQLGVLAYSFNPSIFKVEVGEFAASLVYIVSSRTVRATKALFKKTTPKR